MNYQVPQFIEVEDKIVGPLTIKQFIYLAGGAGISFAIYRFIPIFFIAVVLIIVVMAFSLALAFYKVHEKQPFINLVEAALKYISGTKLYLWKKSEASEKTKLDARVREAKEIARSSLESQITGDRLNQNAGVALPKLSQSKLKDLAWGLDIQESIYSGYSKDNKNKR